MSRNHSGNSPATARPSAASGTHRAVDPVRAERPGHDRGSNGSPGPAARVGESERPGVDPSVPDAPTGSGGPDEPAAYLVPRPTWSEPVLGSAQVQSTRSGRAGLWVGCGPDGRWSWRVVVEGAAADAPSARGAAEAEADAHNLVAASSDLIEQLLALPHADARVLIGEALKARLHAMLLEYERDALKREVAQIRERLRLAGQEAA